MKTKALDLLSPIRDQRFDGERWIQFDVPQDENGYCGFDMYSKLPKAVEYDNAVFRQMSWNSDTCIAAYKAVPRSSLARPCR